MLFLNIDEPKPHEIKDWMKKNDLSINNASEILGISRRQFARILSGESKAKRLHALAMQMVWLINENKRQILDENVKKDIKKKSVKIPIR
ncbi:MAG: hypothetical protein VX976_01560 [Pseudomonadota bacterium]|nr:hypothetical protein [Pseudomonadota bacterium]